MKNIEIDGLNFELFLSSDQISDKIVELSRELKNAYLELGYDLIEIPTGTIEQRVSFLLEHI